MQNKLAELLEGKTSVAIGGHVRPDGDCVGACMGLYQYLKENYRDIETEVYLEEIPSHFSFIRGTEEIRHEVQPEQTCDLFICLDCGDAERLGFSRPLFERAGQTFCVDHHISNQAFADENYIVPDASSTSELIFRLLDREKITKEMAEALYIGIVHDTGVCSSIPAQVRRPSGLQRSCWRREWMPPPSLSALTMRRAMRRTRSWEEPFSKVLSSCMGSVSFPQCPSLS